jgi:hypothetical protein
MGNELATAHITMQQNKYVYYCPCHFVKLYWANWRNPVPVVATGLVVGIELMLLHNHY